MTCKKCNQDKPESEFYDRKIKLHDQYHIAGKEKICKKCRNKRTVETRNKESWNEYQKQWRKRNPGYMAAMQRMYRQER